MALGIELLAIVVVFFMDTSNCAYQTKAKFPKRDFARLRLTDTLPELKEFTLCVWMRHDIINQGVSCIFSYALHDNDNELFISAYRESKDIMVQVSVGENRQPFNCTHIYQEMGDWQHLCVTWFGPDGSTNVYINGEQCGGPLKLSRQLMVRSGGVAIIGQEQDAVDRLFHSGQAWIGDLAELHMWNEVLSNDAIWEAGKCDTAWTNGNVISWLKTPMTAYDGVILTETQLCKF